MGRPTTNILLHPEYNELAHVFYTYLTQLGYNDHSCKNKWRRLKEFLHFAETTVSTDITAITTKDVLDYYEYLKQRPSKKNGKQLHQKTIWDCIRGIQDFYTMLQEKGEVSYNPTSTIKIQYPRTESNRTALTQAEIKELYSVTETLQERAILALAYGCGLRVSELVQCNIEDIKLREGIVIVPKGKGNKSRIVPMNKTVTKNLADYFFKQRLQQQTSEAKALILHSKLQRMKKGTYNKILQKIIARTNSPTIQAKQISIHNLRHSIATHLIEQGLPLERVREFLGHSQLESTEIYTHISQQQLQKLVG